MASRPSQTHRGQRWLENFHPAHRDAAQLLVDSIAIADEGQVRAGLTSEITRLRDEAGGGPFLLVPVMGKEDIERRRAEDAAEPGRSAAPNREEVAYKTYRPGMPISATPGSEGAVGNLIRSFAGEDPDASHDPWLHPRSPLEEVRDRRCRALVLVSDYAGSGRQVIDFAESFVRNKTIRSWKSSGLVRIVVVVFAASTLARVAMEGSRAVNEVRVARPAVSFADMEWSHADRAAIEALCLRYADRRQAWQALGFNDSRGLFVMHTGVPNNVPYILRRRGKDWSSFFEGRAFPEDLKSELGPYRATPAQLQALAASVRQQRLAQAIDSGKLSSPADRLAVVLALSSRRKRTIAELAHALRRPDAEVKQMVTFLISVGMLAPAGELTPMGREELANAKRLERVVTAGLQGTDDPYYPQALR